MKKKFGLYSKQSSDLIHQVDVESESEAISFFAKTKDLKKKDLLEIFDVKEIKSKAGN
jgi:hypothetical protein